MQLEILGNENGPVLVCVPGLLGGPEDFRQMLPAWESQFLIIIPDPNAERREQGLNLSEEAMREVTYESSAADIAAALRDYFPDRKYYFVGISLGGKIVYDFALRFPELFSGGIITDVGPGSFEESELFRSVEKMILDTNLEQPWSTLRLDLRERIQDKNLRILIQSQISYPKGQQTGIWKTGMQNFKELLQRQSIDDQFETFEAVSDRLAAEGRWIGVLHASDQSGISANTFARMQDLKSLKIKTLANSSHFMHITHKVEIESAVCNLALKGTPF